jgi:hypothetical protein
MFAEAQRLVEGMGTGTAEVAGKGHLVAARRSGLRQCKVHHALADALPLPSGAYGYVFDYGRGRASVPEVVHDEQRKRTHGPPFGFGHVQSVAGVLLHSLKKPLGGFDAQRGFVFEGVPVQIQDLGEVGSVCHPNRQFHSEKYYLCRKFFIRTCSNFLFYLEKEVLLVVFEPK